MASKKVMVTLDGELLEYLESKAKAYGIAKSAVFMMALGKMKEQDEVIGFFSKLTPEQASKVREAIAEKERTDADV